MTYREVTTMALCMPGVEASRRYDGSTVLKARGTFLAGIAMHPSAEPHTLVVRHGLEERDLIIADAPETYYLTDYYRAYPLVLARLSKLNPDALRDLLAVSWQMAVAKAKR
jgi:hypothetical protein